MSAAQKKKVRISWVFCIVNVKAFGGVVIKQRAAYPAKAVVDSKGGASPGANKTNEGKKKKVNAEHKRPRRKLASLMQAL